MLSIRVTDAIPLQNTQVLVFFEDGKVKKFDVKSLFEEYPEFRELENPDIFRLLTVEPGGYGISWTEDLDCSEGELYENGSDIDLSIHDFIAFAQHGLISTSEASQLLGCSKQNIDDLVRRNKLHPIKTYPKNTLFLRSEIDRRTRS